MTTDLLRLCITILYNQIPLTLNRIIIEQTLYSQFFDRYSYSNKEYCTAYCSLNPCTIK